MLPATNGEEMQTEALDIEAVNDRLASTHSIDDYYERARWPVRFVERRRLRIIRGFVGDAAGLDVLEVGSGGGHVLRMFPTSRLVALDVSGVYLDNARRNLAGFDVQFVKGEVDKLDWGAARFDRVICTEVLEHVVDPDAVLAAITRLLRPSGIAVVTVPNDPLISRLRSTLRRLPGTGRLDRSLDWGGENFHLHSWSPGGFERFLSRHLRIVERRGAPSTLVPLRACFKCVAADAEQP